jgi:hypothetical protein
MKCVKVESDVVEGGTDRPSPSWGEGLFAGSSPVVDTNDRCSDQGKCLPPQHNSQPSYTYTSYPLAYEDGTDSVPKRRILNTTRRGTTQKIIRNIQNTVKA